MLLITLQSYRYIKLLSEKK